MEFGSLNGGEDGEYTGAGFVTISQIFVMGDEFFFGMESFDKSDGLVMGDRTFSMTFILFWFGYKGHCSAAHTLNCLVTNIMRINGNYLALIAWKFYRILL